MRKYHELLTNSDEDLKIGNHQVIQSEMNTRLFLYHGNVICVVDDSEGEFYLDNCGYSKSSSTTCALNGYRAIFKAQGYIEVEKPE